MRSCRNAADQVNAQAQFNPGFCYAKGQGVPRSSKKAVRWYRQGADQGHADAQNIPGACYTKD